MKIINQTADEMVLKEGSTSSFIFGIVLLLVGIYFAYHLLASSGFSNTVWIPMVTALIGVVVLFSSSSITVRMSKPNGQIGYQKKRLIGGQSQTYAIADVLRVETRKQWQMQNAGSSRGPVVEQQVLISQSFIVFKNGKELPLDHQKNSGSSMTGALMSGVGTEVAIATQVANFLGVPFQEIAPPNSGINIGIGSNGIQL